MNTSFKISISTKLLIVISLILLSVTIPLAFEAADIFKKQSTKREESANLTQASGKAQVISVLVKNIKEKVSLIGSLLVSSEMRESKKIQGTLDNLFENEDDILALTFYKNDNGVSKLRELVNKKQLEKIGESSTILISLEQSMKVPFHKILKGEVVVINRSLKDATPILTIGLPLAEDNKKNVIFFVVADINQNSIQKIFSDVTERKSFLVSQDGIILAHPNDKFVVQKTNVKDLKIVTQALESKISQGQNRYQSLVDKQFYFGAYSHTDFGAVVVTEAPESIILEPALLLKRKVYYLTGVILSLSLILIFLFSLTLTRPIIRLAKIAVAIGHGNFDIPVVKLVSSSDEVGALAHSVQSMIGGLKERDKVKTILNKFHGSTVAQDLISHNTIERKGIRKEIAILFCDIRGFTTISEKSEPEDVVSMLNEYFNTLVRVITKNNGVIDKFIGDAIMAIWGVPQPSGTEATDVVKAALGMRKALAEYNVKRISEGKDPILFGIGIHYGSCISGIIGSEERLEYSVIGDTVNLCSRIESLTKKYGVDLLATSALQEQCSKISQDYIFEEIGSVTVKGKEKPTTIFKVTGYYENGSPVIVETPYSSYPAS